MQIDNENQTEEVFISTEEYESLENKLPSVA